MKRYTLLIALVLSSLAAWKWPATGIAWDPFVASKPYFGWLVGTIMFALGCLLKRDEIENVVRRWPLVLAGTTVQYLSMPLLAWTIARLLPLSEAMFVGVVLVGCVPGAMASNVLTLAARGNVSYSVSLTTAATLLSPIIVPAALWLTLGSARGQDPGAVALSLVVTVVGPVVAGHLLCRFVRVLESPLQTIAPWVANVAILWIIAAVVGLNRGPLGESAGRGTLLAALLAINVGGYLAGYYGGALIRLPESMRRALTIEVGMQNAGVGTFLATQFFSDPETAIAPAVYTFGCMLTGTVLAQWWAKRAPADADRRSGDLKGA